MTQQGHRRDITQGFRHSTTHQGCALFLSSFHSTLSLPTLALPVTLPRVHCAPLRLQRLRPHTTFDHAVPRVVHARQSSYGVTRPRPARPPELRHSSRARPHHTLKVGLVRQLAPQARLSSKHQLLLCSSDVGEWVEAEHVRPVSVRAPRVAASVHRDPAALTAVLGSGVSFSSSSVPLTR